MHKLRAAEPSALNTEVINSVPGRVYGRVRLQAKLAK